MVALADLTTLRVGGAARHLVTATTAAEIVDAVRTADEAGEPVLVLGGGSNLVVADEGFDGVVVRVATRGLETLAVNACGGVMVTVAAGEPWDELVMHAVESGWAGIESMAGIPGSTGATPIQNVGAYGQEVATTIARVRTYDRVDREVRTFMNVDCGFGYRTSRFKGSDRYVVLDVTFQLRLGRVSEPVRYAELAERWTCRWGAAPRWSTSHRPCWPFAGARAWCWTRQTTTRGAPARSSPTRSCGRHRRGRRRWPAGDGWVKVSAAWLIEHAGFAPGLSRPAGARRAVVEAHAGSHQPRLRHRRRRRRACSPDPCCRARSLRHRPGTRTPSRRGCSRHLTRRYSRSTGGIWNTPGDVWAGAPRTTTRPVGVVTCQTP